ncbi:diguanylate cyclase [Thiolapillus sp.]
MSNSNENAVLDRLVRAEKLQLLYRQSFPAIFASLFTGVLICASLWSVQDHSRLLFWYGVLVFSAIARGVLFLGYWRASPEGEAILSWERPYFLTLLASSIIWGMGVLFILPPDSLLHQVIIFLFLVGMAGGALAVYSAHRAMTLATIGCILLPITVFFISQMALIPWLLVAGVGLFIVTVIKAGEVLSLALDRSFRLGHELEAARAAAEHKAHRDALTGLYNRRAFYELGKGMLAGRGKQMLAMIVSDLDHFKQVNDSWGHPAGDKVLQDVGQMYRSCLRNDDLCARLGGEEFGVLLLVDSLRQACSIAEDLRHCLENTRIDFDPEKLFVTASFGVATGNDDLDELFRNADAALYRAKTDGRNCVRFSHAVH